jgi:7-keto-8-aminopelargonate synthetase-like enzyme
MERYKHNDMASLAQTLKDIPQNAGILIITDGVFSMGGDIANLPDIVTLAKKYGARVMVDDAHALGVIGEGGRGSADYFGLTDEVDVTMGTFSKSLASLGGFMAADKSVVNYVMHNSRPYIFSASIPPANCATALAALRHLKAHPELVKRLAEISRYVREGMQKRDIKIRMSETPIVPIYTHDIITTLKIGKALYDEGVYVNPVLPPATAPTECLIRTSYMASHTEDILDEAMDIIRNVLKRFEL